MIEPDALINVRFLTSSEGGREHPIQGDKYGCPLIVKNNGFDCRFILGENMCFELGKTYQIPIKFLDSEYALSHIQEGETISLWEGKTIATGKIIMIIGD